MKRFLLLILILLVPSVAFGISGNAVNIGGGQTDNNFTSAYKTKLDGIAAGAEVNVNADWNASIGDAQILHKPTLGSISTYEVGTLTDGMYCKYVSGTGFVCTDSGSVTADGLPNITSATEKTWDLSSFTITLPDIDFADDSIDDADVNWGSSTGQVDLDDVPDGTSYEKVAATDVTSGHVSSVASGTTNVVAAQLGTQSSPDTTGGAISWTAPLYMVWANTTTTYALPAAAGYAGKAVGFQNTGNNIITIDPDGSEVIVNKGTAQTGGVTITLSAGAGNFVYLFCTGTRWVTQGYIGTVSTGA